MQHAVPHSPDPQLCPHGAYQTEGMQPSNRGFGSKLTRVSRQLLASWGLGWGLFFFFLFLPGRTLWRATGWRKWIQSGRKIELVWQNGEMSVFFWKLWRQPRGLQKHPPYGAAGWGCCSAPRAIRGALVFTGNCYRGDEREMKMSSRQRLLSSKNKKGVGKPLNPFCVFSLRGEEYFPPAESGPLAQRAQAESSCCMLCSVRVGLQGESQQDFPSNWKKLQRPRSLGCSRISACLHK